MEIKVNKVRNWFLTINEGAECFEVVPKILESFENAEYSCILHDKDNEEQPHWHVCILFKNARTFETMQNKFKGAHIEIMESKYKCFRYLLHLDDADKFQYDIKQVIQRGNNVEYYIEHDEYIKLDTESVLELIGNGTINNIFDAVKVYGIKQTNMYKNIIKELLEYRTLQLTYVPMTDYQAMQIKYNELYEQFNEVIDCLASKNSYIRNLEKINNDLMLQVKEYEKMLKGGLI